MAFPDLNTFLDGVFGTFQMPRPPLSDLAVGKLGSPPNVTVALLIKQGSAYKVLRQLQDFPSDNDAAFYGADLATEWGIPYKGQNLWHEVESVQRDLPLYFSRCHNCGQFMNDTRHVEGITNRCDSCSSSTLSRGGSIVTESRESNMKTKLREGTYEISVDQNGLTVDFTIVGQSQEDARQRFLSNFPQFSDNDIISMSLMYEGKVKTSKLIQNAIWSVARGANVKSVVENLIANLYEDTDVSVQSGGMEKPTDVIDKGSMTTSPQAAGGPSSPPQGEGDSKPYKTTKEDDPADEEPGGAAAAAPSAPTDGEENSFARVEARTFESMFQDAQRLLDKILSEDDDKKDGDKKDDKDKGKDGDEDKDDEVTEAEDDDKDKKDKKDGDSDDDDDDQKGTKSDKKMPPWLDKKKDESKKLKVKEAVEIIDQQIQLGEEVTYTGTDASKGVAAGTRGTVTGQFPNSDGYLYAVEFENAGYCVVPHGELARANNGIWSS